MWSYKSASLTTTPLSFSSYPFVMSFTFTLCRMKKEKERERRGKENILKEEEREDIKINKPGFPIQKGRSKQPSLLRGGL